MLFWGIVCCLSAVWMLLAAGCNTQGCTDNRSALPMMGFYSMATHDPIMLDSLVVGGVGAPGDSLLVNVGESRAWVYLPFRYDSDKTSFFFHYAYKKLDNPALDDVVTISYESEPYFASEECGAYYRYRITGVEYTSHLIDSVGVVDSLVTNVDMERIRVFFRIAADEEAGDDNDDDNGGMDEEGGDEPSADGEEVES